MSTSPMQLAANQANALLSTGPRTDAGKEIVSTNALSHGLTSTRVILPGESQQEFDKLRDSVVSEYGPGNPVESELVEQIAANMWRLRRAINSEATFTDRAVKQILNKEPSLTYAEAQAAIFSDKEAARDLKLFLRYYTSIERSIAKALAQLKVLQKIRAQKESVQRMIDCYNQRVRAAAEAGLGSVSQPPAKVEHRTPKQFFKRRKK